MHRDAKIREYNVFFDSYLSDKESLIIQLCDQIFQSGFVFQDSNITEIENGEWVIRDFFDQQAHVFMELVSRERLKSFINYLKNFDWSKSQLKKKLCQRIVKAFDQLAKGNHHHFNIRQNISNGLLIKDNHPLYDLLLYIETYYNLILVHKNKYLETFQKDHNLKEKQLKLEDLAQLRNQVKERLIGSILVKSFLKNIAKKRSVSYESLTFEANNKDRKYPKIIFVVPSNQIPSTEKLVKFDKIIETEKGQHSSDVVELNIKSIPPKGQNNPNENQILMGVGSIEKARIERKNKVPKEMEDSLPLETIPKNDEVKKSNLVENINFDEEEENISLVEDSYDTDVVFGNKKITQTAMENFVIEYPDSTLKFIFRKNLDGRPLLREIEEIYLSWEERGLYKNKLKKFVLELMELSEFPELPINNLLQILREKIYETSKK